MNVGRKKLSVCQNNVAAFSCCCKEVNRFLWIGREELSVLFSRKVIKLCDNYRGITLLSHVGKLYNQIIERSLLNHVEEVILECQMVLDQVGVQ